MRKVNKIFYDLTVTDELINKVMNDCRIKLQGFVGTRVDGSLLHQMDCILKDYLGSLRSCGEIPECFGDIRAVYTNRNNIDLQYKRPAYELDSPYKIGQLLYKYDSWQLNILEYEITDIYDWCGAHVYILTERSRDYPETFISIGPSNIGRDFLLTKKEAIGNKLKDLEVQRSSLESAIKIVKEELEKT